MHEFFRGTGGTFADGHGLEQDRRGKAKEEDRRGPGGSYDGGSEG